MDAASDVITLLSHETLPGKPAARHSCYAQCCLFMTAATVACALCGVLHIGAHVEMQARRAFLRANGLDVGCIPKPSWVGATWLLVPLLCVLMH